MRRRTGVRSGRCVRLYFTLAGNTSPRNTRSGSVRPTERSYSSTTMGQIQSSCAGAEFMRTPCQSLQDAGDESAHGGRQLPCEVPRTQVNVDHRRLHAPVTSKRSDLMNIPVSPGEISQTEVAERMR